MTRVGKLLPGAEPGWSADRAFAPVSLEVVFPLAWRHLFDVLPRT